MISLSNYCQSSGRLLDQLKTFKELCEHLHNNESQSSQKTANLQSFSASFLWSCGRSCCSVVQIKKGAPFLFKVSQ